MTDFARAGASTAPVPPPVPAWIGLGSNLGDRLQALRDAISLLVDTPGVRVVATSSVYESEPWGYREQPPFLNAVGLLRVTVGPLQLLTTIQMIEQRLGRKRRFRWGPREIDLDLLYYADLTLCRRGLTLPHPAIEQRAFVVVPLRELAALYKSDGGESIDVLVSRVSPDTPLMSVLPGGPGLLVR